MRQTMVWTEGSYMTQGAEEILRAKSSEDYLTSFGVQREASCQMEVKLKSFKLKI